MAEPYTLTAADIVELRSSLRTRPRSLCGDIGAPYILYLPAERAYALHAYGFVQATSPRPDPLLACLRAERADPGFIGRCMSAQWDPTHACLDPDVAKDRHAAAQRLSAELRLRSQDEAAERRRRGSIIQPDPLAIDLDELEDPFR